MIVRPKVEHYAEQHTGVEPPVLAELAAKTKATSDLAHMMVGRIEGRLLSMLVHMVAPKLVLEIGTFTGYSALSMAETLPSDGRIITCEIDPEHAAIARANFAASPWGSRIEVRLGPALDTIAGLPGPFDLVFLDAHRCGYCDYFDAVIPKLSQSGVMVVDNTLHLGKVIVPEDDSPEISALREFNAKVAEDPRVEQVVLTVRQGMTIIRRA